MADSMDVDAGGPAGEAAGGGSGAPAAGGGTPPGSRPSPLFNYVVSAQPPTAVTHAAVGHFTAGSAVNLILG